MRGMDSLKIKYLNLSVNNWPQRQDVAVAKVNAIWRLMPCPQNTENVNSEGRRHIWTARRSHWVHQTTSPWSSGSDIGTALNTRVETIARSVLAAKLNTAAVLQRTGRLDTVPTERKGIAPGKKYGHAGKESMYLRICANNKRNGVQLYVDRCTFPSSAMMFQLDVYWIYN
jgi:hypothetical protein